MAIKVPCNKIIKCVNPVLGVANLHNTSGGEITLKGSNVTEINEETKRLETPNLSDMVDTGDVIPANKIVTIASLPEWLIVQGNEGSYVWIKAGVDSRFLPQD